MDQLEGLSISNEFVYEPLINGRTIRLLQICPNSFQPHGFSLALKPVTLDEAPPFCSLSYTWKPATALNMDRDRHGDDSDDDDEPDTTSTLQCDSKDIVITQNLFYFLCQAHNLRIFTNNEIDRQQDSHAMFPLIDDQTIKILKDLPTYVHMGRCHLNQSKRHSRAFSPRLYNG